MSPSTHRQLILGLLKLGQTYMGYMEGWILSPVHAEKSFTRPVVRSSRVISQVRLKKILYIQHVI